MTVDDLHKTITFLSDQLRKAHECVAQQNRMIDKLGQEVQRLKDLQPKDHESPKTADGAA